MFAIKAASTEKLPGKQFMYTGKLALKLQMLVKAVRCEVLDQNPDAAPDYTWTNSENGKGLDSFNKSGTEGIFVKRRLSDLWRLSKLS